MFGYIDPRRIFQVLDSIDDAPESYALDRKSASRRVFTVLACVACCLFLIHYLKYSSTMLALLGDISEAQGKYRTYWWFQLRATGFGDLIIYAWWTFWHVVGYVLIPWLVIRHAIKARIVDFGWRWAQTTEHWRGYLLLLSPILVFIFVASLNADFLNHYPFYKQAGRSWFDLISWELLYLTQFVCLEFFFRGFFLQALRPAVGANAVWIMCVPYLMIHFPKLWPEALGAIPFGLFLGILALRSNSIWGGFLVHAGVAVGMDMASLWRQGALPTQWWPG